MRKYEGIQSRMVALLSLRGLSAETTAVTAELIATNARFELWGAMVKKKEASAQEMLEFVERIDEWDDQCRVAAATYVADGDEEKLRGTLISVTTALKEELRWTAPRK
jgi:hypothetical protein